MSKLHVFDMDGTLLHGASVEELSRHLGCFDQVSELEEAYRRGEVADDSQWWEEVLELWSAVSESNFDAAFEKLPWIRRIAEVFADIAHRGEHSVVISQSPLFVVERLRRWGVPATFATTIERGVPVRLDQLLSAQDKVVITRRMLEEKGLAAVACVAYGDGPSDVELFRELSHTVAVNATPLVRSLATTTYDGDDLWEAYSIGRALLTTTSQARA